MITSSCRSTISERERTLFLYSVSGRDGRLALFPGHGRWTEFNAAQVVRRRRVEGATTEDFVNHDGIIAVLQLGPAEV